MKTNGTLCQLPDLRGGATHQFRKAGARNAPGSAAWEDSHRPQSLKRCRAFDENLFNIFDWLTRRVAETVYVYMTNWYSQTLWYWEIVVLRLRKQKRMGPRKERNACQRTFLLLMLIAVVLFGVHFESDHNGFKLVSNLPASLGSRSVESVYFCFPIAPQNI